MRFKVSLKYVSGGSEVSKEEWINNVGAKIKKKGRLAGAKALAAKVYCEEHKCHQEVVEDGEDVRVKCCCSTAKEKLQAIAME
jgi:hypothetical protein